MKKNPTTPKAVPTQPALTSWIINAGLLAIAVATLLPILGMGLAFYKYVYAAGALLVLVGRLTTINLYRGEALRVRRLARMEFWSAIIFGVGTFFMFWKGAGPTDWIAFTLAGAVLQGYASLMLPRAIQKSRNEED